MASTQGTQQDVGGGMADGEIAPRPQVDRGIQSLLPQFGTIRELPLSKFHIVCIIILSDIDSHFAIFLNKISVTDRFW